MSARPGRRYALSISDPRKFLWVRNAKVATRSITDAFAQRPDLAVAYVGPMRPYPTGHRRDYYSFAFVREPFERLVSCWRDKVVGRGAWALDELRGLGFDAFVQALETLDLETTDRHVRPQSTLVPTERIDFLGRFEDLVADWTLLCRELDLGELSLGHVNRSSGQSDDDLVISAGTAERIRRLYRKDFQLFGYDGCVPERWS